VEAACRGVNLLIALFLMEANMFDFLDTILGFYANCGNPSGETLKCHVCHHDYERPDMMKCATHDAHVCSLCLSTDKVADHVLPAQL
jgi:hypothetical protein